MNAADLPSRHTGALRLPLIDALRGLAAAAVLLFHSLASFEPGSLHPALATAQELTRHGWLGVHVFFVLSGWCIAERLAAALRKEETTGAFLRDRALRIYPSYLAALLLAIALRLIASPFNHAPAAAAFPASPLDAFGDLSLLHGALGTPAYLIVSWTLFYEISFYAAAALALALRRRRLVSVDLLLIAGALLCVWPWLGWSPDPLRALERWGDFYLGVLVWSIARRPAARLSYGCLAVYMLFSAPLALVHSNGLSLLTTGVAAALLWVAARHPRLGSTPLHGSLAWLGAISYSLYLIHIPILSPLMNLAGRFFVPTHLVFPFLWLAAVATALAAGAGFHRLVETPLETWRRNLIRRRAEATGLILPSCPS